MSNRFVALWLTSFFFSLHVHAAATHYQTLRISEKATPEQIERAFASLGPKDRTSDHVAAYEVLRDETKFG